MDDSSLQLDFPAVGGRRVVSRFDGGDITSDAGWLLVSEADQSGGLTTGLADGICDRRQQTRVKHDLLTMLRERIYAIVPGYEDANDLDTLRDDPALKVACSRLPSEEEALASQPTICRLENSVCRRDLYRMGWRLAEWVVSRLPANTRSVVLDSDSTCDPFHGQPRSTAGCLFDGHYGTYCYQPLCVHVTDETGRQRLLGTLLRSAAGRSTKGIMGSESVRSGSRTAGSLSRAQDHRARGLRFWIRHADELV